MLVELLLLDATELSAQLELILFLEFFDGAQVVTAASLRSLADVRIPAVITFVAYWVVAIPGGYLFGVHGSFGAIGIWAALAAGLAFAAVLLGLRFLRLTRT